ncbi:hypothetical protein OMAG_000297 [Candidatus Omnitrophus magneticus]|uniref:Uncharacterized protein n=1 Tax=Candidatus Omnitrophus magneticus TaxID=1609969 RepID=A0A0F0CRC5_9BACT|nr:hypothetical protein OMAG_000297 [Candidatus Omnitrophus magneticus]
MKKEKCEVEVFSRVTGFFRPVQSWNKGKVAEFHNRKMFDTNTVLKKDEDCRNTKTVNC